MTTTNNSGLFGLGVKNEAYQQYFIGQSYLNALAGDEQVDVNVSNVTFEPGCRNNWHIHHNGYQILVVKVGIKRLVNQPSYCIPATWSQFILV